MSEDEKYMQRCLELARLGKGKVSPNPMVGCVIVENGKIIAEGFHKAYGEVHAEVNALKNVTDKNKLASSTLYVNLEPCSHQGQTPPCADMLKSAGVGKVVIGTSDPNPKVAGKGITILKNAGVEVTEGVLSKDCLKLNKRFFAYHQKKRPYILLKWAQSADGFIGKTNEQVWLTGEESKKLVHKWRTEEQAILVGTNTAKTDNPKLTARLWEGNNPVRVVIDRNATLSNQSYLLDGTTRTMVFTEKQKSSSTNVEYIQLKKEADLTQQILQELYEKEISSLIVEGGAATLASFIEKGLWDEARVFTSPVNLSNGIPAPELKHSVSRSTQVGKDKLDFYYNQ